MIDRGFATPTLDRATVSELRERARRCRGHVLTMTTVAGSGHPGGSLSSMELFLALYHFANIRPDEPLWPGRDRIVVSHGHTSPGVYSALADAGFFAAEDAIAHFRQLGSPFEGHVERCVPGVEWSTGNLGQGLSVGVGFALSARMTGGSWRTFVAMSDGEQHKGQVAEARRLAAKEGLAELTVVVDLNGIQISGATEDVMPVRVAEDYRADGWGVIEVDGHDFEAVYGAIAAAVADRTQPVAVVAHTVIGKGVSFMEGKAEFHGRALNAEEYAAAMEELELPSMLDAARELRAAPVMTPGIELPAAVSVPSRGELREYGLEERTDNRSAWGAALVDVARSLPGMPIAVVDCDLAVSVKTDGFEKVRPGSFVQAGVGEHNAATVAGALAASGVLTFLSDFGVFGIDEVYNQQRLNDINDAGVKVVVTHCGLDVGEDGKTHQCLDYVGALRNLFGFRVIVPADANQTDRAVRLMAGTPGNAVLAVGRSKLPIITAEDGSAFFGGEYRFEYGRADWVRTGEDATIVTMGTVAAAAVAAADSLRAHGLSVGVCVVSAPLELDSDAMERACQAEPIVVAEDHHIRTGLAASVAEWLALRGTSARIVRIGVDGYRGSGTAAELLAETDLDADGIASTVRRAVWEARDV